MRKLIAVVAVAAGLMLGSVSNAAPVDIFLTNTVGGNWEVTVTNNSFAGGVGALNFLVSGLTGVSFVGAPATLSVADSSLSVDALGDGIHNFLILQNTITGASMANVGQSDVLLATLSGLGLASVCPVSAGEGSNRVAGAECVGASGSENIIGSATLFDANGDGVGAENFSITVVPEPTTVVLLGLGLAALGFVRRSA